MLVCSYILVSFFFTQQFKQSKGFYLYFSIFAPFTVEKKTNWLQRLLAYEFNSMKAALPAVF